MKKTILILLATLCVTVAFGQEKVKTTVNIPLYEKPDLSSKQTEIKTGTIINLGSLLGDFREATYKDKLYFLHHSSYRFCIPPDSVIVIEPTTIPTPINHTVDFYDLITASKDTLNRIAEKSSPGDDLYSAGRLLLTGVCVGLVGGAISYALIVFVASPILGILCGIATSLATLILQIEGYAKLKRAGEKFNIGGKFIGDRND
jgi:hypothetical protein